MTVDNRNQRTLWVGTVYGALFLLAVFFIASVTGLIELYIMPNEQRTYSSSLSKYNEDFPDTYELSIGSTWSQTEYDRNGFRNQKYRRTAFRGPGGLYPFVSPPGVHIHWREKQENMSELSVWLWTEIMRKDHLISFSGESEITIGLEQYPAVRYDFEKWIAVLLRQDSADYAILIYLPDKRIGPELLNLIDSSFVIFPDG